MMEILRRAHNPVQLLKQEGEKQLALIYQKDIEDLIIYIRYLEKELEIDSVLLYKSSL